MKISPTAAAWLHDATLRLTECGGSKKNRREAALEAQVLLAHALNRPRAWLLAHPEVPLPPDLLAPLAQQLDRLAAGVPLPYLTGEQEFFGLDFEVTPDVLIPRPETELLVETALAWLQARSRQIITAADVGTGSGCIAVALAHHAPNLRVFASDRSPAALAVARRNLLRHSLLRRVTLLQADLLTALRGPLDLLCANLPYIPSGKLAHLSVARHEPRLALDGGPDGLSLVAALLSDAPRLLAPGGLALLEIEAGQGPAALQLAQAAFPHARATVLPDLAGLDRLIKIEA